MEIGVSLSPTKSRFGPLLFAGDLDAGLKAASKLGYDGVELSLLDSTSLNRMSIVEKLRDLNLKPYAIATGQTYVADGYSLFGSEGGERIKAIDRVKGHIDFAAELKCMVIIGGIRGKIEAANEEEWKRVMGEGKAAIACCAEYADRSGITLLLEPINRYETNVANTLEEGLDLIKQLGHSCLKLLPDTFHMNIEEASIAGSIIKAGAAIGYLHFADSNRLAPGWGHFEFRGLLSALNTIGYRGPIGIEVLPKPDDHASAVQAIHHVRMLIGEAEKAIPLGR